MSDRWHHHHDTDTRIVYCYGPEDDECDEEYDGLICDGQVFVATGKFARCPYPEDLAVPEPAETVEQPALFERILGVVEP